MGLVVLALTWQEVDTSNGNGNEEPTVVVARVPSFLEGVAIHLEEWESLVACGTGDRVVVLVMMNILILPIGQSSSY